MAYIKLAVSLYELENVVNELTDVLCCIQFRNKRICFEIRTINLSVMDVYGRLVYPPCTPCQLCVFILKCARLRSGSIEIVSVSSEPYSSRWIRQCNLFAGSKGAEYVWRIENYARPDT
jgi:hypothetical protein